jgi:hypothetical protein
VLDSISSWVEARDTHEDDGFEDGEAVVESREGTKVLSKKKKEEEKRREMGGTKV